MVRATIRVVGVLFIMAIQWATADHDGDMLGRIAEPWPTPEHDQCSVWILDAADGRVTECLSSVLNLATTGAGQIALEYVPPLAAGNTAVTVGSVKFELIHANSGAVQRRIENQAPYMLLGDVQSKGMRVYFPWTPALGNHWLTVTEHTGRQGRGEVQRRLQVAFTVVDSLDPTTQQPTPSRSLSPATAGPTAPPTLHLSPPSPTPTPTQFPTPSPTPVPTPNPTPTPTRAPTLSPTRMPSVVPTPVPTRTPTLSPSPTPSSSPTPSPTPVSTLNLTQAPIPAPTPTPTPYPSPVPTLVPNSYSAPPIAEWCVLNLRFCRARP